MPSRSMGRSGLPNPVSIHITSIPFRAQALVNVLLVMGMETQILALLVM
jgi:hypothetical protein